MVGRPSICGTVTAWLKARHPLWSAFAAAPHEVGPDHLQGPGSAKAAASLLRFPQSGGRLVDATPASTGDGLRLPLT